jgi:hypothetical protein
MTSGTIQAHHQLRLARLGHVLLEALPGAALRIGRSSGAEVTVAGVGDPRSDFLPCQHRAALCRALDAGRVRTYADALGLVDGDEPADDLTVELVAPRGTDLGLGVYALDEGPDRRLFTVTTLGPRHASAAVRAARTIPLPAHHALTRAPDRAELRQEVAHDRPRGITLLSWLHRPHPAVLGAMEDVVRGAAAACAVEELLHAVELAS